MRTNASVILDERALRYFLAAVRSGSIRSAADNLNIAASAISRHIAELEARCGLPLLVRLPRGIVPTEAGKLVAAHAQQMVEDAEQLALSLERLRGSQQGAVRICCCEGLAGGLAEEGLLPFTEAHPDISIHVSIEGTDQLLELVAGGEADIGLAYCPVSHEGVRSAFTSPQTMCVLVYPEHRLANRQSLSLRDLVDEPMVLLPPCHGVRQLIKRVEESEGFRLTPRLETGSTSALCRYVLARAAITVLASFAVSEHVDAGRLVAIPLLDEMLADAAIHLLVRAGRRVPPAVEQLANFLTSEFHAFTMSGAGAASPERRPPAVALV